MNLPERPPCINGFWIPQYYRIETPHHNFTIGAAPRSGSTSLYFMAKHLNAEAIQGEEVPEAVCIIRHPIKRLASAWLLLPEEARRLPEERVAMYPPVEETIDAILDGTADEFFTKRIGDSRHAFAWMRQSELYGGCEKPHYVRLDGLGHIYGLKMPHYNSAERPKPEVTHRVDELVEYYREDLEIWDNAPTSI